MAFVNLAGQSDMWRFVRCLGFPTGTGCFYLNAPPGGEFQVEVSYVGGAFFVGANPGENLPGGKGKNHPYTNHVSTSAIAGEKRQQ